MTVFGLIVWFRLAFLPVSNITDAFIELTDNDDLLQELVSYFETLHWRIKRPKSSKVQS